MPISFPPADPSVWATWNVTFQPDTSTDDKDQDKNILVNTIEGALGPGISDPNGDVNRLNPQWNDIDGQRSQLKVEFVGPDGSKIGRGIVRPPAVSKPPASRIVAVELAR